MNGFSCFHCSSERSTNHPTAAHVAPDSAWASQQWGGPQQNYPHGLCSTHPSTPQLRQPFATSTNECNRTESPLHTAFVPARWVPSGSHLKALLSSMVLLKGMRVPESLAVMCLFGIGYMFSMLVSFTDTLWCLPYKQLAGGRWLSFHLLSIVPEYQFSILIGSVGMSTWEYWKNSSVCLMGSRL